MLESTSGLRERERVMKMIVMILTNQRQNMRKENRKQIQLNDKKSRKRKMQTKSITFIIDHGNKDISYADRTCNERSYTKELEGDVKVKVNLVDFCSSNSHVKNKKKPTQFLEKLYNKVACVRSGGVVVASL